jgi:hypothetical protein
MKRVYKYKEQRRLKPGEFHEFYVLKELILPDGNKCLVMADPFGDKHLIPSKYYKNYPIQPGSFYLCHIDKINCQGKIFIEPVHPYYKQGKVYPFVFAKKVIIGSKKGDKHYYLMTGQDGEPAFLPVGKTSEPETGKEGLYLISNLKKGKIFLDYI